MLMFARAVLVLALIASTTYVACSALDAALTPAPGPARSGADHATQYTGA